MSDDGSLREILRDRIIGEDRDRESRPRRSRRHLTDDQAARLFDAAIAVLAATRDLVGVGEDILRERRDRLTEDNVDQHTQNGEAERPTRTRIDLTY